jgi:hypothetical protein
MLVCDQPGEQANFLLSLLLTSFLLQLGHSKAAILIRNLSLPLAWPVEEYFGAKKGDKGHSFVKFGNKKELCHLESGGNSRFSWALVPVKNSPRASSSSNSHVP